tara:strand:+ start:565 stop:765 length:201 start_codon:yes stop_codon:yes gene_type:complete
MSEDKKSNWVSWSYDSISKDIAESIMEEVNFMLKGKGMTINYCFDDEQQDWDYKLELDLQDNKSEQ